VVGVDWVVVVFEVEEDLSDSVPGGVKGGDKGLGG